MARDCSAKAAGAGLARAQSGLDPATRLTRYIAELDNLVRWQSGDAADCKSANVGSIPARTSIGAALLQCFGCAGHPSRTGRPGALAASVELMAAIGLPTIP